MHKKSCPFGQLKLAEEVGFEPTDPLRSTVFKTAAFDRSAILPNINFDIIYQMKAFCKCFLKKSLP